MKTLDSRNHAKLVLNDVHVGAAALLGAEGEGFAALDGALDRGRVCLAELRLWARRKACSTPPSST